MSTYKPPEIIIKEMLQDDDLLSPWVDYLGRTQQAPTVQLFEFLEDASNVTDDGLILLIRNSGSGSGSHLLREPSMSIMVFSDKSRQKFDVARNYAEMVKDSISVNYDRECIIGVNIIGDVAGPYNLASGRRYFELNLQVFLATGVTQ